MTKLRIPREVAEPQGEAPARTIPFSDDAILAIVEENESLKRQIQGMGRKLDALRDEANEARGKLSEYVLTSGGRALLDTPDILAGINDVKAMLDRQAQWMTAYGLRVDTEREDRTFLAEQDALGRGR